MNHGQIVSGACAKNPTRKSHQKKTPTNRIITATVTKALNSEGGPSSKLPSYLVVTCNVAGNHQQRRVINRNPTAQSPHWSNLNASSIQPFTRFVSTCIINAFDYRHRSQRRLGFVTIVRRCNHRFDSFELDPTVGLLTLPLQTLLINECSWGGDGYAAANSRANTS